MRSKRCLVASLLVAAVLGVSGTWTVQAQTPPSRYFPETGHSVQGDFMRFFDAHGGLEIFGYPLTEAFIENGRLVQYFQQARMEAHPASPDPYRVRLGPLAWELGYGEPPIPISDIPPASDPDRRYFPETGHTTGYAFLHYFNTRGGVDIFGYPITEFKLENGRIVQYFQRMRMEWHPQLPPGQRVQLGKLGEVYVTTRLDPLLSQSAPAIYASDPQITSLRVSAALRWSITGPTGRQILHVHVLDQRGRPVRNAASVAAVCFPSGVQYLEFPNTDANGHAQIEFDLGRLVPGQSVVVRVRSSWGAVVGETQTAFFVWW